MWDHTGEKCQEKGVSAKIYNNWVGCRHRWPLRQFHVELALFFTYPSRAVCLADSSYGSYKEKYSCFGVQTQHFSVVTMITAYYYSKQRCN